MNALMWLSLGAALYVVFSLLVIALGHAAARGDADLDRIEEPENG